MSSVSVTRWKVICRHCLVKLNVGEIRIDTTRQGRRTILHCGCFLETETGPSLRSGEELEGWSELSEEDQERVRTIISGTQSAPAQPTRTSSLQTSSSPPVRLPRSNSLSSNSPALPSSSAPSLSHNLSTSTSSLLSQTLPLSEDEDEGELSLSRNYSGTTLILSSDYSEEDEEYGGYEPDWFSYSSEPGGPPPPKAPRLSDGTVVMPNLLEGVNIPEGPARTGEECSVCLDPPVHPVTLPCSHVFCFLCAKGLIQAGGNNCSLCRKQIPLGFLQRETVLAAASVDIHTEDTREEEEEEMTWFYEGKNGWWNFEERNKEELEQAFSSGSQTLEMMICGQLYVINFARMEQHQKNFPTRKRKIKRDVKTCQSKGVAGIQNRK